MLTPFETLESRRLLAATLTNGRLDVLGGSGGDIILVQRLPESSDTITVTVGDYSGGEETTRRETETFDAADVTEIFIDGDDGADFLDARGMRDDTPVIIYGNAKSDVIYGSGGDDYLRGGSGNDAIYGGGGRDTVDAGGGDDLVGGNGGADRLSGYYGVDTLVGGGGSDVLHGGDEDDVLEGGAGNDRLYGESGDDSLNTGAGSVDHLYGGAGDDTLYAFSNRAYVDGGPDRDSVRKDDDTDYRPLAVEVLL